MAQIFNPIKIRRSSSYHALSANSVNQDLVNFASDISGAIDIALVSMKDNFPQQVQETKTAINEVKIKQDEMLQRQDYIEEEVHQMKANQHEMLKRQERIF